VSDRERALADAVLVLEQRCAQAEERAKVAEANERFLAEELIKSSEEIVRLRALLGEKE
jgi:hypothetical protein